MTVRIISLPKVRAGQGWARSKIDHKKGRPSVTSWVSPMLFFVFKTYCWCRLIGLTLPQNKTNVLDILKCGNRYNNQKTVQTDVLPD